MLRKAAEGGYDKIGWVTGEQTADRYDLSRRIDGVQYDNGIQMLTAIKDDAVVLARRVKPNGNSRLHRQGTSGATTQDGTQRDGQHQLQEC